MYFHYAPGIRPDHHLLALCVALLVGIGQSLPLTPDRPGYIVGARDVLAIAVWGQGDLSGRFAVEEDGTFMFPLAGRITAAGRRTSEIEADLRERLGERFLTNPQVSVVVEQYLSQQIHIMGEVQRPGSYAMTGPMSLIEALARAGSTTQRAGAVALIVRSGPNAPNNTANVIRVPLEQLQRGNLTHNVTLAAGDTIFVPRAETVFVLGAVNKPGEYVLEPEMTVLQLLAVAGGVSEHGSTGRLRIVRRVDGRSEQIGAKLTHVLRPGDTLIVRERIF